MKPTKKIVVLGNSCAGKTTFSMRLAASLHAKHVELDALHWEPKKIICSCWRVRQPARKHFGFEPAKTLRRFFEI